MKTQISLRHKKVWNEWPGLNNCELCIKDPKVPVEIMVVEIVLLLKEKCSKSFVYCGLEAIFKSNQHITFIKKSLPGVTNTIILQPYKEKECGEICRIL